jgi:hypothetical protein
MLARLRAHLKYSNVTASVAVLVALGGGAYAATQIGTADLKNKAVTTAKIKNNAIQSKNVRDGSLLIKDLAGVSASGGIRGPQGQKGPTGDQGPQGRPGPAGAKGTVGDTGGPGVLGAAGKAGASRAYTIVTVTHPSGLPKLLTNQTLNIQDVVRPAVGHYCVIPSGGALDPALGSASGPIMVSPDFSDISSTLTGKIFTYVDTAAPNCQSPVVPLTSWEVVTMVDGLPSNGVGFDIVIP